MACKHLSLFIWLALADSAELAEGAANVHLHESLLARVSEGFGDNCFAVILHMTQIYQTHPLPGSALASPQGSSNVSTQNIEQCPCQLYTDVMMMQATADHLFEERASRLQVCDGHESP